eukprot:ANDGO_01738.mRNA.1 Phosphatidate phosphatase PAH2
MTSWLGSIGGLFEGAYSQMEMLSGAIDVLIIEHDDGSLKSSPFHVRFGRLKCLRSREKLVRLRVNGELTNIHMKIGYAGEAFFIHDDPSLSGQYRLQSEQKKHEHDHDRDRSASMEVQNDLPRDVLRRERDLEKGSMQGVAGAVVEDQSLRTQQSATAHSASLVEADTALLLKNLSREGLASHEELVGATDSDPASRMSRVSSETSFTLEDPGRHSPVTSASTSGSPSGIRKGSPDRAVSKSSGHHMDEEDMMWRFDEEDEQAERVAAVGGEMAGVDYGGDSRQRSPVDPQPPSCSLLLIDPDLVAPDNITFPSDAPRRSYSPNPLGPSAEMASDQIPGGTEYLNVPVRKVESDLLSTTSSRNISPATSPTASQAGSPGRSPTLRSFFSWLSGREKAPPASESPSLLRENSSSSSSTDSMSSAGSPLTTQSESNAKHMIASVARKTEPRKLGFNLMGRSAAKEKDNKSFLLSDSEQVAAAAAILDTAKRAEDTEKEAKAVGNDDLNKLMRKVETLNVRTAQAAATKFEPSLTPKDEDLKELRKFLKPGANSIEFEVFSRIQGTQRVSSRLFLWPASARVVISDVDGTITKSDLMGQILPLFGKDWTHSGIGDFYSNVLKNGYSFLYLTTRSIVQANMTTKLIQSANLPEGPVLTSPDLILHCLAREVILRTPQEFKIAALRKVQSLFPPARAPHVFYAGFGNRPTDQLSYETVGVPASKVFLIDTKSHLKILHTQFESYTGLNDAVDHLFPPVRPISSSLGKKSEDVQPATSAYADFMYWKGENNWLVDLEKEILAADKAKGTK